MSYDETKAEIDRQKHENFPRETVSEYIQREALLAQLGAQLERTRSDPRVKRLFDAIKKMEMNERDMPTARQRVKNNLERMPGADLDAMEIILKHNGATRVACILYNFSQ